MGCILTFTSRKCVKWLNWSYFNQKNTRNLEIWNGIIRILTRHRSAGNTLGCKSNWCIGDFVTKNSQNKPQNQAEMSSHNWSSRRFGGESFCICSVQMMCQKWCFLPFKMILWFWYLGRALDEVNHFAARKSSMSW